MIAADTNLVIRHLTHDDVNQTAIVARIFGEAAARGEPIFLGHVVLCEVCWTLTSVYRFEKVAIVAAVAALLEDGSFLLQDREVVEQALSQYRRGSGGFSDYLIGEVARRVGATAVLTFDRRLSRAPGFALAK